LLPEHKAAREFISDSHGAGKILFPDLIPRWEVSSDGALIRTDGRTLEQTA
jgi:hypothetical protein